MLKFGGVEAMKQERLFPDTKANGKFPNPEARCLAGGAMGRNSSTSPLTAS
jgi:hypothetical protein